MASKLVSMAAKTAVSTVPRPSLTSHLMPPSNGGISGSSVYCTVCAEAKVMMYVYTT
jgi:hypothetical protein